MLAMPMVGRALGIFAACIALCACSGAEWKNQKVTTDYQPAKQLTLTVVSNAQGDELKQAVE
ncbi:MAG: hypothetical protein M3O46_01915, partial [Myxococcota bacterium]|nr:hypothetical protein [Myxococcota bacterium]